MNNEIAIALMELSNLSLEKDRVNPRKKLTPVLKELKVLEAAVNNGIKKYETLSETMNDKKNAIIEIEASYPKLEVIREKGKERLSIVKGMSLKEMLAIQQVVAKAEENLVISDSKIRQFEEEILSTMVEMEQVKKTIAELKKQYNNKVIVYNKSKKDLELALAALESKEETLRLELDPKILTLFDETARLVPLKPVAFLRNDICTGCCVGVSGQTRRLVANSDTLQCCENCKRILLSTPEAD